jgi:hypothetical protein
MDELGSEPLADVSLNWYARIDVMWEGDLKMSEAGHGREDEGVESRNVS